MHIRTRILLALVLSACLVLTPHCKPKSTESEPAGKPTATPATDENAKAVEQLKSTSVIELLAAANVICQSDDESAWQALRDALVDEEVLKHLDAHTAVVGIDSGPPIEDTYAYFALMMRIVAEENPDKAASALMWLVEQKPYVDTYRTEDRSKRRSWRAYLAYDAFQYIKKPSKELMEFCRQRLDSKTTDDTLKNRLMEALAAYGTAESLDLFKTQLWRYGDPILLVQHRNNYECVRLLFDIFRTATDDSEYAHKMLVMLFAETYQESPFWPEVVLPKINPQGEEAKKFVDLLNGYVADHGKIVLTDDETKKLKELIASIEKNIQAGQPSADDLATAMLFHTTRPAALEYLLNTMPDEKLMPSVIEALKWGDEREQLLAIRILSKNPDKMAIPVLLEFALQKRHVRGYVETGLLDSDIINLAELQTFVEGSVLLHKLTDGAIGLPDDAMKSAGRDEMLATWRDWWDKNSATVLPDWHPDEIGKNEDEIRKWCAQRLAAYGKDVTQRIDTAFAICVDDNRRQTDRPGEDLWRFKYPDDLKTPAATPLLIMKILETSAQVPDGAPKPEDKDTAADALAAHRDALMCLSYSGDRRLACQFILWALENHKIKDGEAAAYALGRMTSEQTALDALQFILQQEDSSGIAIVVATEGLGMSQRVEMIDLLLKMLPDNPAAVRKVDYRFIGPALSIIGTANASNRAAVVKAVAPFLTSQNPDLVEMILDVFQGVKGPEAIQALREALPKVAENRKEDAGKILNSLQQWETRYGHSTTSP